MNQHPTHGARVRFDLRSRRGDDAVYDVTVYAQDDAFRVVATLESATGKVQLEDSEVSAPAWVAGSVLPFAKQLLSARRASPTGQWPRRVLRWRAARTA